MAAVFPSDCLRQSLRKPVAVELKTGATYNGVLASADQWMNLVLVDAVLTNATGTYFQKSPEVCVRGNSVRTIRVVSEALESRRPPPEAKGVRQPPAKMHRTERR
jgi:U6 snRNA-associated Sm-like protein LSm4